ncbi:MAG TPA: PPOX class F420-dependent oxidoreductase [Chloroflexota bacterium]|jgi:PPOX class probable F420-dependent enzyme|nr:PPOX class F420-dependent oxidoreductase [Chloroflexota bacterium]
MADMPQGLVRLLKEAAYGQIATLMPDGSPQVTQVWVDTDGNHILVNSVATHQKVRNVRRDPRVAVNVVDPAKPYRVASVRGQVVELTTEGAREHIDALSKRYLGQDIYPFGGPTQQRIILKILPERVNSMGLDG